MGCCCTRVLERTHHADDVAQHYVGNAAFDGGPERLTLEVEDQPGLVRSVEHLPQVVVGVDALQLREARQAANLLDDFGHFLFERPNDVSRFLPGPLDALNQGFNEFGVFSAARRSATERLGQL